MKTLGNKFLTWFNLYSMWFYTTQQIWTMPFWFWFK